MYIFDLITENYTMLKLFWFYRQTVILSGRQIWRDFDTSLLYVN